MEQLIIFLLFVIGSLISAYVQKKKAQAEQQQQRELEDLTRRSSTSTSPTPPRRVPEAPWPQTAADWQEQLRRMLQGETAPPPPPVIIKPVLLPKQEPAQPTYRKPQTPSSRTLHETSKADAKFQNPLNASEARYERASKLHETVQARLRAASDQTTTHKAPGSVRPAPSRRREKDFIRRLRHNPSALREAFLSSLIFGPPRSLDGEKTA